MKVDSDVLDERIKMLLTGLKEAGIDSAVIVFETEVADEPAVTVVNVGSDMTCLALTRYATRYQKEKVDSAYNCYYYDDDEGETV